MVCKEIPDVRERRASKLSQEVARAIAASIRDRGDPPGSRLGSERALARELGVSRATLREALVVLQAHGIAQVKRGSGIYVLEPPMRPAERKALITDPLELAEARHRFEGEAAALAALTITDEEVDKLTRLIHAAAGNEDREAAERTDRSFHLAIAAATRNTAIARTVERLLDVRNASPACRTFFDRLRDTDQHDEDHAAILRAIGARDPDGARDAMHVHLSRTIEQILAATEANAIEQARASVALRRDEIARRLSI